MPKNSPKPDFLTLLAKHNAINGITATFSESKKTARRLERAFNDRKDETLGPDEYLRILYSDHVADEAVACVDGHKLCRNCEPPAPHHESVQRRLSLAAA